MSPPYAVHSEPPEPPERTPEEVIDALREQNEALLLQLRDAERSAKAQRYRAEAALEQLCAMRAVLEGRRMTRRDVIIQICIQQPAVYGVEGVARDIYNHAWTMSNVLVTEGHIVDDVVPGVSQDR